ncbi:hypothetical protein DB345_05345 [Spartobacteria bacterium LR76]|nr:hypothetical protein DB345_05345 [Spartobacteria bacterium LR76]
MPHSTPNAAPRKAAAFTLIELLAASAVFIVLLGIILAVTNSVSATIRHSTAGLESSAAARTGFDLINRYLSQATLNPYWDYDNPLAPSVYLRQSDLQFIIQQNTQNAGYGQEIYFVSPEAYSTSSTLRATRGLMNACSAFVQFGSSEDFQPSAVGNDKYRYRLMLGLQPTEGLKVFNKPARQASQTAAAYRTTIQQYWDRAEWLQPIANKQSASALTPLIDNVIAFIAWPRLPAAEDEKGKDLLSGGAFSYNSQANAMSTPQSITANQLPPVVELTMIVISEASAARLDRGSATPPSEIESALSGRFANVDRYQSDLDAVSKALSDQGIDFKIFTAVVPLRESKWSRTAQ